MIAGEIGSSRDSSANSTRLFQPRGHVVWEVKPPGRDREFKGYSIYEKSILILSKDQDNILVGAVRWQDAGHFTFKALADRPGEPGLMFARAP